MKHAFYDLEMGQWSSQCRRLEWGGGGGLFACAAQTKAEQWSSQRVLPCRSTNTNGPATTALPPSPALVQRNVWHHKTTQIRKSCKQKQSHTRPRHDSTTPARSSICPMQHTKSKTGLCSRTQTGGCWRLAANCRAQAVKGQMVVHPAPTAANCFQLNTSCHRAIACAVACHPTYAVLLVDTSWPQSRPKKMLTTQNIEQNPIVSEWADASVIIGGNNKIS